ncbi:MAG: carbohydrate binding domain-containing protein [Chitinivibrionales bacterium]
MLVNGDFSSGSNGWLLVSNLEGASATGSVENQEYHVSITDGGTVDYAIQLNHPGLSFVESESYRVTFDARADAPRTISAKINQSVDPWATYYSTEHSLGTTYQTFTFTFTMNHPTDDNARVEFDLGLSDIDVYIDNVEVVSMSETGTSKAASRKNTRLHLCQTSRTLTMQPTMTDTKHPFTAALYDLRGQTIRRASGNPQRGTQSITFDIASIPHGIYVLRVEAGKRSESRVIAIN